MPTINGMERNLTSGESAIVKWMVQHSAKPGESIAHLAPLVGRLHVVGNCKCGCPSIDFKEKGTAQPWTPIGDARGISLEGLIVGVLLWGNDKEITGLEVYSETGEKTFLMPTPDKMKTWDQRDEA